MKKTFLYCLFLISFLEVFLRYIVDINDQILYIEHPKIEYEIMPSQNMTIFHNNISINSLGMRSDELEIKKDKGVKRLLIYGDSIVFGGNITSQENLATQILQRELNKNKKVFEIGNISAGSWGPANWLAHLKENGSYNADYAIIVINSKDYYDIPTYKSIENNLNFPTKKNNVAIFFLFKKYLIPIFKSKLGEIKNKFIQEDQSIEIIRSNNFEINNRKNSIDELEKFIDLLEENGIKVYVLQYWDRNEFISGIPRESNLMIRSFLKKKNVFTSQSIKYFQECSNNPDELFFDNMHPSSKKGQDCLANSLKMTFMGKTY